MVLVFLKCIFVDKKIKNKSKNNQIKSKIKINQIFALYGEVLSKAIKLFKKSILAQMPRCLGQMPRCLEISFKFSCKLSGLLVFLEVTSLTPKESSSQGQHKEVFYDKNKNN